MTSAELCQYLDWDSDFFHKRIARVIPKILTPAAIRLLDTWGIENKIDCLYYLADCADTASTRLAEADNFHFVDIRLTFEIQLQRLQQLSTNPASLIRGYLEKDKEALCKIARTNHRETRFYADSNFPGELCDLLYETWMEKSCNGSADRVLVAECEDNPVGYVTCSLKGSAEGQIGLVGLHPNFRGRGYGKALIKEALHWFVEQDVRRVVVVTQGQNRSAQKLYQNCGFVTSAVELWYHRWF